MKKKQRKALEELARNPQGGIIMALKQRGGNHIYKQGSVTKEDIDNLIEQLSKEKPPKNYF